MGKSIFSIGKILVFIGILISIQSFANDDVLIRGLVKDKRSGLPISFANIFIPELNLGTATNLQGEFKFEIPGIDSILVSAIGYDDLVVYLKDSSIKNKLEVNISMIPRSYNLAEVKVRAYPTYSELKRGILDYKMTEEELNMDALYKAFSNNMAMLAIKSANDPLRYLKFSVGLMIASPVTAIYNLFSRDAKNQRKYYELLATDNIKSKVAERINFEIVSRLTGMKEKKEVQDFIAFCDFEDSFVLAATEIQLYERILERYHEYTAALD